MFPKTAKESEKPIPFTGKWRKNQPFVNKKQVFCLVGVFCSRGLCWMLQRADFAPPAHPPRRSAAKGCARTWVVPGVGSCNRRKVEIAPLQVSEGDFALRTKRRLDSKQDPQEPLRNKGCGRPLQRAVETRDNAFGRAHRRETP